jgi:hypothetical protein
MPLCAVHYSSDYEVDIGIEGQWEVVLDAVSSVISATIAVGGRLIDRLAILF